MIRRAPDLGDLDREIRDHIEEETLDNIARGMSEDEARAAAIRKFGNVTRVKEDVRGVWVPGWLDRLRQDARDAVRYLRRNPAFSFAIVLTLTLGIGLTTAIYSVVNAVLLRPLNYQHPDRMVWLATVETRGKNEIMNSIDFTSWSAQATSLEHMVAYDYVDATVVAGAEAARLRIVQASDGFWDMTGATPLFGTLPPSNEPDVLVLTHRVFREQFHADPGVIGRAISIDGRQATIGAVLPDDFRPQLVAQAFRPALERVDPGAYRNMVLRPPPTVITPRTQVQLYMVLAELKGGVSVEQARAEIEAIHTRYQREHPTGFGTSSPLIVPLQERVVGPSAFALRLLLAAAVVVLLITCANVASLLFSRSSERRKEIALRMSVGSSPLRVVRQVLAECVGYALLGGAGGVLLAYWLIGVVVGVNGSAVPRLTETNLDPGVLAVALALSIGTALLFGVGPAIALCFTNVQEVLKDGGRSVSHGRRVVALGRTMVAVQVALTIVLLAGAGLLARSVWTITSYPPGLEPDHILMMRMDFRGPQYREQRSRHDLAAAMLAKAKALPGVSTAALSTGRESTTLILREGQAIPQENRESYAAPASSISADFGKLLGMPLVSGRWFEETDTPNHVMINETLARRFFPGEDPLGGRIRLPWVGESGFGTIIGVVSDWKYVDIDTDPKPEVFYHHADTYMFGITVMLRVDGDPVAAAPEIRKALTSIDPTQTFYDVQTLEHALSESIAPRRFNLLLLGTFALVALVLAVLGVYSVVAFAVSERTQEIGIRLALGAERARVVRMIVAQGMWSVGAGLAGGMIAAAGATRVIAGLLYGVEPHDAATFAFTALALGTIAFLACALPALRAAMVDPATALRAE